MLLNLALVAVAAMPPSNPLFLERNRRSEGPEVEVWTSRDDDLFRRGEQVRIYFRSSESGYVTIFRIDTDGRVRVLYPVEPWDDNFARADQRYEVRSYGDRYAFSIDDYPGQGYIFAVSSRDPFNYASLVRGDHWDYRQIAEGGRVTGDPYVALTDLVDRIVPANYTEYSYDVQPYYVEQRHQYPRFLCYDCHSYASYPYWNPYSYSCFRFRIVIYDDFYYYPRRDYRGSRVVYRTAPRIAPRYVFKDRGQSQPFVTTVRERPTDASGRRLADPGITRRDLGGSGRIPAPIVTGRERRPSTSAGDARDVRGGSSGARRLSEPEQTGGAQQAEPANRRPEVVDPNNRPSRQPAEGGSAAGGDEGSGRRPEYIIPPAPSGEQDRPQPQLERRDPNARPETRTDPREEPRREEPRRDDSRNDESRRDEGSRRPMVIPNERPRVEREREPERQPDRGREVERQREPERVRQPERQREPERARQPEQQREPERPRVERQPEARPEPQSKEPERRAEPRSEPRRTPVEEPQDPEGRRPD